MPFEHSDQTAEASAQPETVATLLRQLGVHKASGVQEADALRDWVRANVPNKALQVRHAAKRLRVRPRWEVWTAIEAKYPTQRGAG